MWHRLHRVSKIWQKYWKKTLQRKILTYCNYVNYFVKGPTWFSTHAILAWIWRFLLWILVRIECSCYKLLLVYMEQSWREIKHILLYLFFCIIRPNIIKIGLESNKLHVQYKQQRGWFFWIVNSVKIAISNSNWRLPVYVFWLPYLYIGWQWRNFNAS